MRSFPNPFFDVFEELTRRLLANFLKLWAMAISPNSVRVFNSPRLHTAPLILNLVSTRPFQRQTRDMVLEDILFNIEYHHHLTVIIRKDDFFYFKFLIEIIKRLSNSDPNGFWTAPFWVECYLYEFDYGIAS